MPSKPEVQDGYLNKLRLSKRPARIVLLDGKELRCTIQAFDTFTILASCNGTDILVFKSALAVIGPADAEDTRPQTRGSGKPQ